MKHEYKCPECGYQLFAEAPPPFSPYTCPNCASHPEMGYVTEISAPRPTCDKCGQIINEEEVENMISFSTGLHRHDYCDRAPIEQHEPGAKLDRGKNRLGLVLGGFSRALQQVGKVGTAGANKYSDNGWMEVEEGISRYTDAMMRHYMMEEPGEMFDPELTEMAGEDIYHAACVAWNALARLDLMLRESE